jgi:hypothetical protein
MGTETHNPHNPEPYSYPRTMDPAGRSAAHREICDWLRALGLDPKMIPSDPRASMADGQLTILRKVTGPNGREVLNVELTGPMTETITVPVTVPPPPMAEIWLAPKCPTCGR